MAESTDNVLSILIKLGVIGDKDVKAVNELLAETNTKVGDLSKSMPEGWEGLDKYKNALSGAGEEAGMSLHGAGMRKVIGELNHAVPGLGEAFHGLEQTISGGNAALILIALAIETVSTYWELYKEKLKSASEAQAAVLDKFRTTAAAAIAEQEAFTAAQKKALSVADPYNEALSRGNALLEANINGRKTLLKLLEAQAEAEAKNPEDKARVKLAFSAAGAGIDAESEKRHIELLGNIRAAIAADLEQLDRQRADLERQLKEAAHKRDSEEIARLNKLIAALDERITSATSIGAGLERNQRGAANVSAINDSNRRNAGLFNSADQAIHDNDAAGAGTTRQAYQQLQRSQAIGRQLAQAAKDAAASHSESLGLILAELQRLRAANAKLAAMLQQRPVN